MFFVTLEYEKENSKFNLSFWPHPRITSRCIPIRVESRTRPDYNCVQIQKNCISLGVYNKTNFLYQAEQTDDFYTPSSV